MNEKTILDRIAGALKTDPDLADARSEMFDKNITHDPAQLVRNWVPHEITGLRLVTPEGNFDVTVAKVKAETATARPGP
jgi:hypothetical protein